jgi:hypothetical protein
MKRANKKGDRSSKPAAKFNAPSPRKDRRQNACYHCKCTRARQTEISSRASSAIARSLGKGIRFPFASQSQWRCLRSLLSLSFEPIQEIIHCEC